ncbi:pepsin A-like [Gigaspora margarita]|uniref:Pepsin A-like n=1 Tax=Gigaspora margarita TaxID=4874 RepID=A0A8H4B0Z3_GIGMA|nr:pepsin A-like [Gigaspora margarita]
MYSNHELSYYGPIQLGGQTFNVLFDSGSDVLWVPDTTCNSSECNGKSRYDVAKDLTFIKNTSFAIYYGSGQVSGAGGYSNLTISDLTIMNQYFGLASLIDFQPMTFAPWGGIFGLGRGQSALTLFKQQGLINSSQMAFKFGRDNETVSHFTIENRDLIDHTASKDNGTCKGTIQIGDWILGLSFLKNVYSIFDVDNSRIGFAALNTNVTT